MQEEKGSFEKTKETVTTNANDSSNSLLKGQGKKID